MEPQSNLIEEITTWGLVILVFLLPLFFLPITGDYFLTNKMALLAGGTLLLAALKLLKGFVSQKLALTFTFIDLPVLFLAIGTLLSSLLRTPNPALALSGRGGVVILLTLFYFLVTNHFSAKRKEKREYLFWSFFAGSLVLAIWMIVHLLLGKMWEAQVWGGEAFSPTGSLLSLFIVLTMALGAGITWLIKKEQNWVWVGVVALLVIDLVGWVIAGYKLFFLLRERFAFLPLVASWHVAIGAFRDSPLLGFSPSRYLVAFTRFRPVFLNQTPFWAARFLNSGNYFLHLLTTVGFWGAVGWFWLIYLVVKKGVTRYRSADFLFGPALAGTFVGLVFSFLFPFDIVALFALYFFLAMMAAGLSRSFKLGVENLPVNAVFVGRLLIILLIGGFGFMGWWGVRVYRADYYFGRSLKLLAENKGGEAYSFQQKAIAAFPYSPGVRMTYAQTNLALANALAAQGDLSDQDRNVILQLIQQAIRESRTAASLDQENVVAWENLAQTYRGLINIAQGADQWTAQSLVQAIQLDPSNPSLRLSLGGLAYLLGDFDSAIAYFQQAANLKPDWANAYYNWGLALEAKGEREAANVLYSRTLPLLPADSPEREALKAKLEELGLGQKGVEAAGELPTEVEEEVELEEPEPLPSPSEEMEELPIEEELFPEATESAGTTE